uniref:Uncharacterized protein n=1 Tax=Timema poppense TaxID=170557 RepID=A0A7R9HE08_TIMPO|nr:unnamed protein product [Timema poppensis]
MDTSSYESQEVCIRLQDVNSHILTYSSPMASLVLTDSYQMDPVHENFKNNSLEASAFALETILYGAKPRIFDI